MKHDMKRPCKECPYVGKVPGWIGGHQHPQEFVDLAMHDFPFPCHLTVDYDNEDWRDNLDDAQRCPGQLVFMNHACKLSRDPETAAHQKRLGKSLPVLYPAAKLVAHHLKKP